MNWRERVNWLRSLGFVPSENLLELFAMFFLPIECLFKKPAKEKKE